MVAAIVSPRSVSANGPMRICPKQRPRKKIESESSAAVWVAFIEAASSPSTARYISVANGGKRDKRPKVAVTAKARFGIREICDRSAPTIILDGGLLAIGGRQSNNQSRTILHL